MCGRYTLTTPWEELSRHLLLEEPAPAGLRPRYNAAPSQDMPVVRHGATGRRLALLRWGLVPFWAKDPGIGARLINARSETAAEKPAFRMAFRRRRCLVPADGFYEWRRLKGRSTKQPYHLRLHGGGPLAFAGLWERWEAREGEPLETFVILTTQPNELVAAIHDRMPVILDPSTYARWLDPSLESASELGALLGPFPAERMEAVAVGARVGNPGNDDPELVRPIAVPRALWHDVDGDGARDPQGDLEPPGGAGEDGVAGHRRG